MRGAPLYAPGDVRVDERPDPEIVEPTDAIIRLSATCMCGSDLWPYRGVEDVDGPAPTGHEYVGVVDEVGSAVATIRTRQFVVGSIFASENTCEICRAGYQSSCVHRVLAVAAVSVTGITERVQGLEQVVLAAAEEISARLGHRARG